MTRSERLGLEPGAIRLGAEHRSVLRRLIGEKYADWTGDAEARRYCEELAEMGLCRIATDGPDCWRVYQSQQQIERSAAILGEKLS